MNFNKLTGKQFIKLLYVLHNTISLVVIALFLVAIKFKSPITREMAIANGLNVTYIMLAILFLSFIAIAGFIVGEFISRRINSAAKAKILLSEKAKEYFRSKIVKYALLELPALLALGLYILFPIKGMLFITIATLLLLVVNYPSRTRMVMELDLSNEEQKILNNSKQALGEQNLNI